MDCPSCGQPMNMGWEKYGEKEQLKPIWVCRTLNCEEFGKSVVRKEAVSPAPTDPRLSAIREVVESLDERSLEDLKEARSVGAFAGDVYDAPDDCETTIIVTRGEMRELRKALAREARAETTDPRIAEMRGREQKATRGPWQSMSAGNCHMENGLLAAIAEVVGLPRPWSPMWVGWQAAKNYFKTFMRQEDADFVAHARQDIPYLLNALAVLQQQLATAQDEAQENWQSVKRLTAERDSLRQQLDALKVQMVIVKGDLMAADSERKFLATDIAERDAQLDALRAAREAQTGALASAMRKMLPPALLAEVVAHLDPVTPFVEFLRTFDDPAAAPEKARHEDQE